MAAFTPFVVAASVGRQAPDADVALPDPPRAPGAPLVRPGVARYPGAAAVFMHLVPATGTSFGLVSPVTGTARRVALDSAPPNPVTASGVMELVELSILPFGATASVLRRLAPGLPTFYLGYRSASGAPPPPADDGLVRAGDPLGPVTTAWVAVVFQHRVAAAPWSWIRLLGAAMDGTDPASDIAAWNGLGALYGAERVVRVLDHAGRPAAGQEFERAGPGGTTTVTTDAAGQLDLPPGEVRLRWRSIPITGDQPLPVHALWERALQAPDDLSASSPPGDAIVVPAGLDRIHLQVLDVGHWFAPLPTGLPAGLARFRTVSRLQPLVDGRETFRALLEDLRHTMAPGFGAHFAGWSFNDFPFDPGAADAADTTIVALTKAAMDADPPGDGMRFLMDKFLNFRPDAPVDDLRRAALLLLMAGVDTVLVLTALEKVHTDERGYLAVMAIGLLAGLVVSQLPTGTVLEELEKGFDNSHELADQLNGLKAGTAVRSRHPVRMLDNPLDPPNPLPFEPSAFIDHVGSWHQKFQVVRREADPVAGRVVGYVGGIDVNSNRIDSFGHHGKAWTPDDRVSTTPSPRAFHDVHARVTGPAAADVALTFHERYAFEDAEQNLPLPPAFAPPDPADGNEVPSQPARHIVQIARSGFAPDPAGGTPPLPFAPQGERTIYDTTIRAIQAAREYIYIEDQYFTPPEHYVNFLLAAGARSPRLRLVIVVPSETDQIFGDIRRRYIFDLLRHGDATRPGWGDRLVVGAPVRRPLLGDPGRVASKGRATLLEPLTASGQVVTVGPRSRLPSDVPFWLWVHGELMLAQERLDDVVVDELPARRFGVQRPTGADPLWGATPRPHEAGSPVTLAQVKGIYVHTKVIIVDDVFVGIGSCNANRRGFFHDGEIHAFAVPEQLKAAPENPALALRTALWAEHLGLPPSMGAALLADPAAAVDLFGRSTYAGNRLASFNALGIRPEIGFPGEASTSKKILAAFGLTAGGAVLLKYVWNALAEPTTFVDPDPEPGPAPIVV